MKALWPSLIIVLLLCGSFALRSQADYRVDESRLLSYIVDPKEQDLALYWKDKQGRNYQNFETLRERLDQDCRELVFAMNGGMFNRDLSPQGLLVDRGIVLAKLDKHRKGYGNFYMQPNGIFFLTKDKRAVVCKTVDFVLSDSIEFATQSGPMLLIDQDYHPKFRKGSSNLHIRNGVGVLPDGRLLFAMSKEKINFYDLATFFKQNGCKNALYLDGFVSRTYLPAEGYHDLDSKFGVMIGETIQQ